MKIIFSKATWLHFRFPFSLFLLPVFVFSISQAPDINTYKAWLALIVWHLFVYPASNGYNSYFDKDEGSIALLKNPPKVSSELYYGSIALDIIGLILAGFVGWNFMLAVFVYGLLSKAYSHPSVRLKKYPFLSFFVVFLFQGAFVYWTTFSAVSESDFLYLWSYDFMLAGLICSCLIGASYPLTQVYQHDEDQKRGDRTLSIVLGIRGSFVFSAMLFSAASLIMFIYWKDRGEIFNFWLFLTLVFPAFAFFSNWFYKVWNDEKQANFINMSRMTFVSGLLILVYFVVVWHLK
ncbi:ubiquinone biosynthesis protein UbiA [Pedobacter sp. HMF7647]|uniref:Ubiquinone biosynthesis protein UbiA n=1 Tax=Hufsiella arboris TaxID=2695275 RepID=A0A7K1Y4R0_9SPHI|nr:UbiA family prenyltransferase [Hufsiella arboris]MXV49566.1 ubiquinone biosynthesis protein UbiA [Hufsiella arboris]